MCQFEDFLPGSIDPWPHRRHHTAQGVESDDDVDEDILELRDEIHQKLSAMQFQVKDAQAWLHAAHRSSVPDSAVDTAE